MNDEKMNNLEHTQPLPRVSPDMEDQRTQLLNTKKVRELEPIKVVNPHQEYAENGERHGNVPPYNNQPYNNQPQKPVETTGSQGKGKMAALLVVGFVLAAFFGAALSGYMSEQQAKKDALDNQHQQATRQLRDADSQKQSLQQQKADLEEKYQNLLAQQKEAQSLADKLKGQQEQQSKTTQDKSVAGKVIDKITGDADKQKKEATETDAKASQAQQKLDELNQSVQAAGAAIDEVNAQMDNLDSLRQQAQSMKDDVSKAYNENKDMVDSLLHYASLGLESFKGLLTK